MSSGRTMLDAPESAAAMCSYVLETAPVLALYLDVGYRLVDANAQARRVLCGEAFGRPFAEQIVSFRQAPDLAALVRQEGVVHSLTLSTAAGMPETLSFRFFPRPDGVLALASLDLEEQQALRDQALALNRELNNLTRQLHQANAELRELNEVKNRFIGMAAHDLRNSVGVIMTYSEFVLDEAGDRLDDEQRGFVRSCLTAAAGMKRLIDSFLDVAIIESGHLRLERSAVAPAAVVAGVLPLLRPLAARKRIELLTAVEDEASFLSADAAKLEQVLVNLVINAIEHSRPGQRVWLSARREAAQTVFVVRDEGQGLAPEDQKQLFAPFARAGTRKTAGERSVGLGLAIARLVVEAHSGRIWVESTPGQGSTFFVALPS